VAGTPITGRVSVVPGASDYIIFDGTVIRQDQFLTSTGDGRDSLCLGGLDATYWKVTGYSGSWLTACEATYGGCWTGEYAADTDKMWLSSGSSSQDATKENGSVIVAGGAITGAYGAYLDATTDYVCWPDPGVPAIDDEGTIRALVTTPADVSNGGGLVRIYTAVTTSQNNIVMSTTGAQKVSGYHEGQSAPQVVNNGTSTISASTTYTFCYTWDQANDDHCAGFLPGDVTCEEVFSTGSTATYQCQNEALTTFASETGLVHIGNDCDTAGTDECGDSECDNDGLGDSGFKVDNVQFTTTYLGD
jgi:hypothetical protein